MTITELQKAILAAYPNGVLKCHMAADNVWSMWIDSVDGSKTHAHTWGNSLEETASQLVQQIKAKTHSA